MSWMVEHRKTALWAAGKLREEKENNKMCINQHTVKVKICGLRSPDDARAVNAVLPDYTGFIFDSSRKRYIEPEKAERIRRLLDGRIRPVGVFVNAGVPEIMEVLETCRLDMVQLHGEESDAMIRELREAYQKQWRVRGLCIVKAFRIDTKEDIERAEGSEADEILLDHGRGGTGESFDWGLLQNCRRRFFLAGGLTPENVETAIEQTGPYAVDVSSSLETEGRKDPEKIRRFMSAVRRNSQSK